jgi:hypothetical protein
LYNVQFHENIFWCRAAAQFLRKPKAVFNFYFIFTCTVYICLFIHVLKTNFSAICDEAYLRMREELLLDVVVLRTVGAQPVLDSVHHLNVQLLQL